jgi:hypothetical protein
LGYQLFEVRLLVLQMFMNPPMAVLRELSVQ